MGQNKLGCGVKIFAFKALIGMQICLWICCGERSMFM